jgi:uncharacterized surface protein with fasciclin (FAS1) repeats
MKLTFFVAAILLVSGPVLAQENVSAPDILTTIKSRESLKMFSAALQSSGMAETLKHENSVTVFAVSDRGFAMLSPTDRETLRSSHAALNFLLARYVVRGRFVPTNFASARTLSGLKVLTTQSGRKQMVNGASVEAHDIECANGVVYVLDRFDAGLIRDAVQMIGR